MNTTVPTIDFLGKAITVRSTGGPEVTIPDATNLDQSVVQCTTGEQSETVLAGFTMTGWQRSRERGSPIAIMLT